MQTSGKDYYIPKLAGEGNTLILLKKSAGLSHLDLFIVSQYSRTLLATSQFPAELFLNQIILVTDLNRGPDPEQVT